MSEMNVNLQLIYSEYSDAELIEESVLLHRSLTHIHDQLAIIREIRRGRAPEDVEARVLVFREVQDGRL